VNIYKVFAISNGDMPLEVLTEKLFEGREEAVGITIDGSTSLDLDDAIWLERNNGNYIAHVSIADVGSVVEVGSDMDQRALKQGFTHYFARGNEPMLPRELSEDKLSLHEGQKRPTITISVPIGADLEIGEPTLRRTYLISARKLSYEKAERIIKSNEDSFLGEAYNLSRRLFEKRKADGALVFFNKRSGLSTTEEGSVVLLDKTERYNSHLLIQEFMILANRAVAEYFARNNIQGLFRNHAARASAQNRSDLLSDMEITLLGEDPDRIGTFQQRLSLVLDRASYAPTLSGHYGLNLPAYMHFTSPIRRFADLVNNRQLAATLIGEEPLYDLEQLEVIAEGINSLENTIKDRKAAHFKEKDRRETRRTIVSNRLVTLDTRDFYRVVKVAATEERLTPEIEDHLYTRLYSGELQTRDLYTILLESNIDNEDWARVRSRTMGWLEENPHHAATIITMAAQSLQWTTPHYETTSGGHDHRKTFTSIGSLSIKGQYYLSEPQIASSKKEAEQYAAISLLENILGIESRRINLTGREEPRRAYGATTENYKGLLQERCQQQRWKLPTYDSSRSGPPHQPEFTVVAEMTIDGATYTSDPSVGFNVTQAEQLAAANLLGKIPDVSDRCPQLASVTVQGENYIGALQELLQKNNMGIPRYRFGNEGGTTLCELTAVDPERNARVYSGRGLNKKDAKRNAAELAFTELQPLYQR